MSGYVDVDGIEWEEFVTVLFECEYCEECHGDAEHHTPVLVLGHWFARCKFPPSEEGELHPVITKFLQESGDQLDGSSQSAVS